MNIALLFLAICWVSIAAFGEEGTPCALNRRIIIRTICLNIADNYCREEIMQNIKAFISPLSYRQHFIDICNGNARHSVITTMKDVHLRTKNVKGQFVINKIQDFLYDDILFKYVSYKPMVDIIQSIIGPNITGCHSMLINKPPDSTKDASRHPLHQDLYYVSIRPANSIVTAWTAIETTNKQNGCLFVVPGSHKRELMKHDYPPNVTGKGYHGVLELEHLSTVNLEMEKGDTVLFHPILLHGSGPNLTKGFRKAISCLYADTNCYFTNVKGTIQEHIEKEILEIARKLKFPKLTFEHYLKTKSRLIRGPPGNFQHLRCHY